MLCLGFNITVDLYQPDLPGLESLVGFQNLMLPIQRLQSDLSKLVLS